MCKYPGSIAFRGPRFHGVLGFPWWDSRPFANSGGWLEIAECTGRVSFLVPLPTPFLVFYEITSQIDNLRPNPCLIVCFQGNQN